MKIKILFFLMVLLLVNPIIAQNTNNSNDGNADVDTSMLFINNLGNKSQATFGDVIDFFMLMKKQNIVSFQDEFKYLNKNKFLKGLKYKKNKPLRLGIVALMAARYLGLKNNLFFMMFNTERYAHRSCVAKKIIPSGTSEWDPVSGEDLIDIISNVIKLKEGDKNEK